MASSRAMRLESTLRPCSRKHTQWQAAQANSPQTSCSRPSDLSAHAGWLTHGATHEDSCRCCGPGGRAWWSIGDLPVSDVSTSASAAARRSVVELELVRVDCTPRAATTSASSSSRVSPRSAVYVGPRAPLTAPHVFTRLRQEGTTTTSNDRVRYVPSTYRTQRTVVRPGGNTAPEGGEQLGRRRCPRLLKAVTR
jgi:hypothetical protein